MNEQDSNTSHWLDEVIINAISSRASDIHFEPGRDQLTVRIRVDGLLQQVESGNKLSQDTVLSRIKVLSKLNITEHRVPQDGHYEFSYMGKFYNFRVSTLPTEFGETIVFRILNRDDVLISLEELGLLQTQLELLHILITSSPGMILATGPTGSGKTSLLYSLIKFLNKPEKNVVTVEDPIECEMEHVQQTQINESLGLTFAKAMRAIVRQDPDYIMLGEVRDAETAQMAISAALSGTMVLTRFTHLMFLRLSTGLQKWVSLVL
jgi:type II secretory ATPase GspE/PulE/Tfp pilus assembly ATPase PilB-like protein